MVLEGDEVVWTFGRITEGIKFKRCTILHSVPSPDIYGEGLFGQVTFKDSRGRHNIHRNWLLQSDQYTVSAATQSVLQNTWLGHALQITGYHCPCLDSLWRDTAVNCAQWKENVKLWKCTMWPVLFKCSIIVHINCCPTWLTLYFRCYFIPYDQSTWNKNKLNTFSLQWEMTGGKNMTIWTIVIDHQ